MLLVILVVLNLLNVFKVVNLDGLANKLPTRMVSVLLPSQNFKQNSESANTPEVGAITGVDSFNAAGDPTVITPAAQPADEGDSFDEDAGFEDGEFENDGFEEDFGEDFETDTETDTGAEEAPAAANSVG